MDVGRRQALAGNERPVGAWRALAERCGIFDQLWTEDADFERGGRRILTWFTVFGDAAAPTRLYCTVRVVRPNQMQKDAGAARRRDLGDPPETGEESDLRRARHG